MRKYGYVVVEGPHDVEFVYRLLSPFGLKRVQWMGDLDPFMSPLVPRDFPPGGDLQKRVPVPLFLQNQSHAIAVRSAVGDSRLVETLDESRLRINLKFDFDRMTGVGIILDTDREIPAADRYKAIKSGMQDKGFMIPDVPGTVAAGPPRIGAFALPDNDSVGNLEDLLIECAAEAYPNLLNTAKTHVDAAKKDTTLQEGDGEDLTKTPVYNKAVVGSIGAVLRPGKAVQVSLQDNRWLRGSTLQIPRVKAVQDFLVSLLELV
jgi:hypothetical protein